MAKEKKQDKILRIGIVQGGRIIEERLLRHKEPITIGQSPRNKFLIPSPKMPVSYTLVDVRKGQYALCFEKGMLGKVLVQQEVLDLKTIAQRKLATRKEERFSYPLADDARGKVVLGDVTLLFQFVTPPPEVPRLKLPAEAKGAWWRGVDKALVGCFLLAAFLLGGPGASLEVWWLQTGRYQVRSARNVQKVLETLVAAGKIKPEEKKADSKDASKAADEGIDEAKEDAEPSKTANENMIDETTTETAAGAGDFNEDDVGADAGAGQDVNTDDIKREVGKEFADDAPKGAANPLSEKERMDRAKALVGKQTVLSTISSDFGDGEGAFGSSLSKGANRFKEGLAFGTGGIGEEGGMGSNYLDEGDGLGGIAEGAGIGGPGGGFGGPGGPGGPGNLIVKAGDLTADAGPKGDAVVGPTKKLDVEVVKKVEKKFDLKLDATTGFVGGKIDRDAVNKYLRARQSALQKCYLMVARRNPNVGGKLVIQLKIDLTGRASVKVISDQTGDPALAACITEKVKGWPFPKPADRPVEFKVPLVFRAL